MGHPAGKEAGAGYPASHSRRLKSQLAVGCLEPCRRCGRPACEREPSVRSVGLLAGGVPAPERPWGGQGCNSGVLVPWVAKQ